MKTNNFKSGIIAAAIIACFAVTTQVKASDITLKADTSKMAKKSDKMSGSKMSSDKMSKSKMSSDKMSGSKMSSDKMSKDKMSKSKMKKDTTKGKM
jgi:pentapeptide MXKDX repeat protein